MKNELRIDRDLLRWIVLSLGLVGLIVMAVALIATPGHRFNTVSYVALVVGILGLAGFVLLDPYAVIAAITGRTGLYAITSWAISLFFIAVIVGAFLIIRGMAITPLDLTEAGEYQLSQETLDLLARLDGDVHVTGFYTQQYQDYREEAEIWLEQYKKASNGRITYEFVDPDRDPGEALRLGMTRTGVLVFEMGDQTAEATMPDERNLTNALLSVQLGEIRNAYFITGHGERQPDDYTETGFSQAGELLKHANFNAQPLNLLQEGEVPADADLVIIAGPLAQFGAQEVELLSDYLNDGGSLLAMFDPGTGGGALGSGVTGVDYNATGTLIATSGADGTAKLWNARTGEEELTLRGHTSDVLDVSIAPDGDRVATAGRDGTVRIWDAKTGEEIQQLAGQTDLVQRLAYTPDGRFLVSVGQDQVVNVWDASTYEPVGYSPLATTTPLFALAVSPDGAYFAAAGTRNTATGGQQGVVHVWDASTGQEVISQDLHSNFISDLTFTPDGENVISVAEDGTEGVLSLETGEASTVSLYPDQGITAVAVAQDGTKAYALGDASIHLWAPGVTSTADDVILTGHTAWVWTLKMSPDGEHFVSSSRDGTARVWSLDGQSEPLVLAAHAAEDQLITYLSADWGILVNDDIVVDVFTASAFDLVTPVMYGASSYSATSPITQPLRQALTPTFFLVARSIQTLETAAATLVQTPLLFTSGNQPGDSWGETNPSSIVSGLVGFDEADNPGPVTLGVSAENMATGGRVVVFGDADFASNNALQNTAFGNGDLLINAVNWLAVGEVIDLPSPDVGQHIMDRPLSPAGLIVTTIASVCLIPGAVLVAGGVVWFVRRRRR